VPVVFWKKTPLTWDTLPTPDVPSEALSGFALSHAMSSMRFLAGTAFFERISKGFVASSEIGSKSLARSYGRE
jgi:hypothetical protein